MRGVNPDRLERQSPPAALGTAAALPVRPVASLLVLTGLNLLDYLDRNMLASVLTPIKAELHLADTQLGMLSTAFMLGYFLTSPIFGYLGDRLPRRWLVAAGVLVWSLGTLFSGHAGAFLELLFFRTLVGFGEASFGTISPGWIADLFPPSKRNNAISIFYVAIPVGSAIGYVLGGVAAARWGWRSAFHWAGWIGLALAATLFFLREPRRGATDPPGARAAADSEPTGWRVYLRLFYFRDYVLVVAGYVGQTFALGGFAIWGPTFLHRAHHMTVEGAGTFFGAAVVTTGLVATLVGGYLATLWQRRTGNGYAGMLAVSALGAAPAAFAAFLLPRLAWAQAALVLSMFCLFLATGPVNTLILETVPVGMRASSMAASIFSIHMFGDLWSPQIVGALSDRWGDLTRALVTVLPAALVVSAAVWCWLVARRRRELAASAGA